MDGKNSDENARFRALADQLPAAVWSSDADLYVTSCNGGALAAAGRRQDELIGMSLYALLDTDDRDHVAIRAHRRALAGESGKYEWKWSNRWYETYVEPFRGPDGEIVGTLGMAIDITARKVAEDERASLQQRLRHEHKLEAISQLARGLAHEINNPLQSIINFAQLIRSRSKDATVREYSDGISQEVQSLATIVRNLQCLVHQKADLPVELRLNELVQGTASLFATLLREDKIRLDIRMPEDLRPAWGNAYGVQQVLINLLMAAREGLLNTPKSDAASRGVTITGSIVAHQGSSALRMTIEHAHRPVAAPINADPIADDAELAISLSREIAHCNAGELLVELASQRRAFHLLLPLASEQ